MVVTFTSRVHFINENTMSGPKVSKSLYILFLIVYLLLNIVVFKKAWYA